MLLILLNINAVFLDLVAEGVDHPADGFGCLGLISMDQEVLEQLIDLLLSARCQFRQLQFRHRQTVIEVPPQIPCFTLPGQVLVYGSQDPHILILKTDQKLNHLFGQG